jgi:hypothetical protein
VEISTITVKMRGFPLSIYFLIVSGATMLFYNLKIANYLTNLLAAIASDTYNSTTKSLVQTNGDGLAITQVDNNWQRE